MSLEMFGGVQQTDLSEVQHHRQGRPIEGVVHGEFGQIHQNEALGAVGEGGPPLLGHVQEVHVIGFALKASPCQSNSIKISEIEIPFGKRILIKKRKVKEQMKIILAQYFEIFKISSSGKIYNKNIMKLQEFEFCLKMKFEKFRNIALR